MCVTGPWSPNLKRELTEVISFTYCENQKHCPVKQNTSNTTRVGTRPQLSKPPAGELSGIVWEPLSGRRLCKVETSAMEEGKYRSYPSPMGPGKPSEEAPTWMCGTCGTCGTCPVSPPHSREQQDFGGWGNKYQAAEVSRIFWEM